LVNKNALWCKSVYFSISKIADKYNILCAFTRKETGRRRCHTPGCIQFNARTGSSYPGYARSAESDALSIQQKRVNPACMVVIVVGNQVYLLQIAQVFFRMLMTRQIVARLMTSCKQDYCCSEACKPMRKMQMLKDFFS